MIKEIARTRTGKRAKELNYRIERYQDLKEEIKKLDFEINKYYQDTANRSVIDQAKHSKNCLMRALKENEADALLSYIID